MDENQSPAAGFRLTFGQILLFIVLPLAVGIGLAFLLIPQPVVGVIHFADQIDGYSARDLIAQIHYARQHDEIRAVVIVMDSPGGTVVDTESVYLELARLRQSKPVITVIEGMAASGGYYLAVGTDYIYAKPSSIVGNIGIIGWLPSTPIVMEEIYSTGPYKMWGEKRDEFIRQMEPLKQGFLQAVRLGRGDALNAADEVILSGQIWSGFDALRLGLVDELGTQSTALEKAAGLASIANYRVEDLRTLAGLPAASTGYFFGKATGAKASLPKEPGMYYLYIPPVEVQP